MSISVSGVGAAAPSIVSGASARMPPQQKMTNLFQKIDTAGSGSISKAQFTQAFNSMNPPAVFKSAGANAIYSQLDPGGTGSVSQADFVNGMKSLMSSLRSGNGATGG